jgi:hypothetical protein
VTSKYGSKTTQVGDLPATVPAKIMLRELAADRDRER